MFVVSFIFRFLFTFAVLCVYDIALSKRMPREIRTVENIVFSVLATIFGSILHLFY